MNYAQVKNFIEKNEVGKLDKKLIAGRKNQMIEMWRDYYNGQQWEDRARAVSTRSGKNMYGSKNPNDSFKGFEKGDLKTWNICDSVVDVYTSYLRGDKEEDNRIQLNDGLEKQAEELNDAMNIEKVITRTCHRMCIDSVAIWKYEDGDLEFIDSLEYYPVYYGGEKVGSIRRFLVERTDADEDKKDVWLEIWIPENPEDESTMMLRKYLNGVLQEEGKAPYAFDPHIVVINKDAEFEDFSEDSTEISDIGKIIDLQDDLNTTVTDIMIINRKVALPMFKIAQEVYDKILKGEINGDQLKKSLENLSLTAGRILNAPIERIDGEGIPQSVMVFVDQIFEQVYRATGIPKSVFVSEGLSGLSTKTVENIMESLKRRVDEKRANIEQGMKEWVAMYFKDKGQYSDSLEDSVGIEWASMFATTKADRAELLLQISQAQKLPDVYIAEELLEVLGDLERRDEILALDNENNLTIKTAIETERLRKEIETESRMQIDKERTAREQAIKEAEQAKGENRLLISEMSKLGSEI